MTQAALPPEIEKQDISEEIILHISQIQINDQSSSTERAFDKVGVHERIDSENFREISDISISSKSKNAKDNSDFIESDQTAQNHDLKINESMVNKGFQGGSITERPVHAAHGKELYSQVLIFGGSGFKGPGQRQALNQSLVAIEKLENLPAARSSNRKDTNGS